MEAFFQSWELHGNFPQILKDEKVGKAAKDLYDDAMKMLNSFLEKKLVTPSAVIGFWPANSDCDDIILYKDDSRNEMIEKFYNLRQQVNRTKSNRANFCLSDFVAPKKVDYLIMLEVF